MSAMAKRVVGIGAVLLCAEAKVDPPRWRLGPQGKSCTEVCQTENLNCIAGYWPMSAKTMLEKSKMAGVDGVSSSCDNVRRAAASNKIAPYMAENAGDEECYYQPDVTKIECSTEPASSQRRYCPCSTSAPQFLLADINISCTDYCHHHGGKCSTDPGTWIAAAGQAEIEAMAVPLGMGCNTATSVSVEPFHAPSINGDECYYPAATQLTKCDAKKDFFRRFCPCIGFEATVVSRKALAGDSTGSSSGQCRGGGFQVGEGTGGAKQFPTGGHRPVSQEECMAQVKQYCHGANGATYNHQTSDCWCNIGMTGYKQTSPHTYVCWFSDGTLTMGSSLMQKYSGFHADFTAGGLPTAAAASCALAMALCAAAATLVRQRRQRQCDQADGEFLVRLDQDE